MRHHKVTRSLAFEFPVGIRNAKHSSYRKRKERAFFLAGEILSVPRVTLAESLPLLSNNTRQSGDFRAIQNHHYKMIKEPKRKKRKAADPLREAIRQTRPRTRSITLLENARGDETSAAGAHPHPPPPKENVDALDLPEDEQFPSVTELGTASTSGKKQSSSTKEPTGKHDPSHLPPSTAPVAQTDMQEQGQSAPEVAT